MSVCRGHELANKLYGVRINLLLPYIGHPSLAQNYVIYEANLFHDTIKTCLKIAGHGGYE